MDQNVKQNYFIIGFLVFMLLFMCSQRGHAETMVVERVVPAGAMLTYSEGGTVLRSIAVPEGRVRVTIQFGGPVAPRHARRPERME